MQTNNKNFLKITSKCIIELWNHTRLVFFCFWSSKKDGMLRWLKHGQFLLSSSSVFEHVWNSLMLYLGDLALQKSEWYSLCKRGFFSLLMYVSIKKMISNHFCNMEVDSFPRRQMKREIMNWKIVFFWANSPILPICKNYFMILSYFAL